MGRLSKTNGNHRRGLPLSARGHVDQRDRPTAWLCEDDGPADRPRWRHRRVPKPREHICSRISSRSYVLARGMPQRRRALAPTALCRLRRVQQPDKLDAWIIAASESPLTPFANGINAEHDTVRAALVHPWSNGQTKARSRSSSSSNAQCTAAPSSMYCEPACSKSKAVLHRNCVRALIRWRLTLRPGVRRDLRPWERGRGARPLSAPGFLQRECPCSVTRSYQKISFSGGGRERPVRRS
jgi:hypothetical protein